MITFQRRKLRSWLGSTPEYSNYDVDSPKLLFFDNEEECRKWIIENYDTHSQYHNLRIVPDDDVPDGKNHRSVIFGGCYRMDRRCH